MISKYKKLFNWSCVYCMNIVGEKNKIKFGILNQKNYWFIAN